MAARRHYTKVIMPLQTPVVDSRVVQIVKGGAASACQHTSRGNRTMSIITHTDRDARLHVVFDDESTGAAERYTMIFEGRDCVVVA